MKKRGSVQLRVSKKLAQEILDWCIVKYGKSKHYDDYPDLVFIREKNCYGTFNDNDNVIEVNISKHIRTKKWTTFFRKLVELIKTIIHEYQHYLQSPTHAERMSSKYKYNVNPYEKYAEMVADRDYMECFIDVTIIKSVEK